MGHAYTNKKTFRRYVPSGYTKKMNHKILKIGNISTENLVTSDKHCIPTISTDELSATEVTNFF
jgi:hypothetical protein